MPPRPPTYELIRRQGTSFYDIDKNGVPVAHVSKTSAGYEVFDLAYSQIGGPVKSSKEALRWYVGTKQ